MRFHPITVVNKHHKKSGEYIGRGSVLGNDWSHMPNTQAKFKVATRHEAIAEYRKWLRKEIDSGNQLVIAELERLAYMATESPVMLQCYCKPAACHGDVIKEFIEEALRKA